MANLYARVSDNESQDDLEQYHSSPNLYQRLRMATFKKPSTSRNRVVREAIVNVFAIWGLLNVLWYIGRSGASYLHSHNVAIEIVLPSHFKPEQRPGCDCGDSIAEALTLGCKFDSLSMAWLPEHCRDDELTAEFNTAGDGPNGEWLYYADTDHSSTVDVETVAAMGDDPTARVHMDKTWHRVHCVYYWLKLSRTRFNGKIVEPRSDTDHHIRHCGMVFAEPGYGTISGVALNTNEEVEE